MFKNISKTYFFVCPGNRSIKTITYGEKNALTYEKQQHLTDNK